MQQERLNNLLRQKLGELETLPKNVVFDSSSSWRKLEDQIRAESPGSKGRRKKMAAFKWLAIAATFIGIIATAWILTVDKKVLVTPEISIKKQERIDDKTMPVAIQKNFDNTALPARKSGKNSVAHNSTQTQPPGENQQIQVLESEEDIIEQPIIAISTTTRNEQEMTKIKPQVGVASTPLRKFRIVHINETLPQRIEIAKNNNFPNTGFPFYKQIGNAEANGVETLPDETEQLFRKKERSLMKTLANSIKD